MAIIKGVKMPDVGKVKNTLIRQDENSIGPNSTLMVAK